MTTMGRVGQLTPQQLARSLARSRRGKHAEYFSAPSYLRAHPNLFSLALITNHASSTSTIWQTPNWRPLSQIFFAGHARSTCADLDEVARAARPLSAAGSYGRAESDFKVFELSPQGGWKEGEGG